MSNAAESHDLVIIGAGAAGLAAAAGAYDAGVRDIVVLEREGGAGGILKQCIHNGFGLHRYREELTGPEYALREIQAVAQRDIPVFFDTTVIDLLPDRTVVTVSPERGVVSIAAGAVILAMGSRERTRGMLGIAGTRPAGIYTAGAAQNLINLHGIVPGKEIVMLGSGDIGLIVARRLAYEGAHIKMVLNRSHFSGGLKRNIVQCLDDYGIPLRLSHTITAVHGRERVTAVEVSEVDPKTKQPIAGTEELVSCDTLLLSVGLIPENELTREAGIHIDARSNGAAVDETLETEMPGVFSAGNVLHIHDLVDFVSEEGERAGRAAASYLAGERAHSDTYVAVQPGQGVGYVVPQRVHTDATGKVTFRFRGRDIYRGAQIHFVADGEEIKTLKRRIILPAEMETVQVDASLFAHAHTLEISLDAEEVGAAQQAGDDELTCIQCPMGCSLKVALDADGKVVDVEGEGCPRGKAYAKAEIEAPERVLTSLVDVASCELPLSVRTDGTIPKGKIAQALQELRGITVEGTVKAGELVCADVCGTGVDVIATKDVS